MEFPGQFFKYLFILHVSILSVLKSFPGESLNVSLNSKCRLGVNKEQNYRLTFPHWQFSNRNDIRH